MLRPPTRRAGLGLAACAGGAAAVVMLIAPAPGGEPEHAPRRLPAQAVDPLVRPAFAVPQPRLLRRRGTELWAGVRLSGWARARPGRNAPRVTRLVRRTPEGTSDVVPVLARARDRSGALWVRVRLPVLPNGLTGWVPRAALGGYGVAETLLVVDRRHLRATLLRRGQVVFRAPVGIGAQGWPTPEGRFVVRERLTRYRSPFYGPLAFGTSARSAVLTDWPGGGFVGIHGTDQPGLIPGRVSHGCIRLRNSDLVRLARLMPVGTPVEIR
jgi:hypothetical protein